ncbi:MAG TPA: lactate racemase domain-containing protein, partial [Gaiellaceae bacterium]|nr:lactate racemase domain-containing protein [Gaiellaceae bacterium]
MSRIPLLADARIVVAEPGAGDVVLRPPPPRERLGDVPQAVRDALGFPLSGEPLERLVTRGGTATLVIEQPSLPIPSAPTSPRHLAIAAAADELERLGVAQTTIVVAGGLLRRASPREIGLLVPPEFRRRFRGRVIVHDAEAEDLVELGRAGNVTLRVNRALVETDLVLTVTAAETVVHGGPASLLAATGRESLRAAGALSLLETSGSQGWRLAIELERMLAGHVPVTGVALALNVPHLAGPFAGYPYDDEAAERIVGSRARRLFQVAPGGMRQRLLDRVPRELSAAAVYGGAPSVAHTEALIRGTVFKGVQLDEPVDALVIGIPGTTPWIPRERPNPVSAAY